MIQKTIGYCVFLLLFKNFSKQVSTLQEHRSLVLVMKSDDEKQTVIIILNIPGFENRQILEVMFKFLQSHRLHS